MMITFCLICSAGKLMAQEWYIYPRGTQSRWIDLENKMGRQGQGGLENKGAKGHPSEWLAPGDSLVLMDYEGTGMIRRIWATVIDRSPAALQALRLKMYWDHSPEPAVNAPLSDFFGVALGRMTAFESALFSDPEGKSFNSYIPMPFKVAARIVLVNHSKVKQLVFYDIDMLKLKKMPRHAMYFHAYWHESAKGVLGQDYVILPEVKGRGRFLGANIGVRTDSVYKNTWFGEGEVKVYLDGDRQHPTLAGTGTEDYIGTAWNLGTFAQRYQGCTIADKKKGIYAFYRYHIPDPIYFREACRVTIQQIGGGGREQIRQILKDGGRLKVVSVMSDTALIKILEQPQFPAVTDDRFPKDAWTNFYRLDHYSSTAYYYLDQP